uniref:Uncharacterized protein n=1 Tax=Anopheles culicifacies TaxID=139723 RepID=A0A182M0T9_9DIPT
MLRHRGLPIAFVVAVVVLCQCLVDQREMISVNAERTRDRPFGIKAPDLPVSQTHRVLQTESIHFASSLAVQGDSQQQKPIRPTRVAAYSLGSRESQPTRHEFSHTPDASRTIVFIFGYLSTIINVLPVFLFAAGAGQCDNVHEIAALRDLGRTPGHGAPDQNATPQTQ